MSKARGRAFAGLVAFTTLTLVGSASTYAADTGDGVAAALLGLEDVPVGLMPLGVDDATEFDIDFPSYEANDGLEKANQKWSRDGLDGTEKVAVMIDDFRMLFPDASSAQAYLDAAETTLSESVTGLTAQPGTPVVGDDLRHYAGNLEGDGVSAEANNFLFRVGPVVAKVYLLGFGTTLADVLPIAEAAADRITVWLASRPPASPGASPAASDFAPTPEPSVKPPSPQPSITQASPRPAPSAAAAASLAPVGSQLRQWAIDATASSAYGSSDWSALQATGAPTITTYSDSKAAWAPASSDGTEEWLELAYAQAVVPKAVGIVETFGNGAVVRIEAFDEARGGWVELWTGDDPSPDEIATFSPPLTEVDFATDRLRISFGDIVPGWSEIDAVELAGSVP